MSAWVTITVEKGMAMSTAFWGVLWAAISVGAESSTPIPSGTTANPDPSARTKHLLDEAILWVEACQRQYALVFDYEARLIFQERIGRELGPMEDIQAKYRKAPFGIYFRWSLPTDGEERLIYHDDRKGLVERRQWPRLHVREDSATLVRVSGVEARQGSCDPREIGIGRILHDVAAQWNYERKFDLTEVELSNVKVNGRRCVLISTTHPQPDDGRFDHHTMRLYIDREHVLPIRLERFGYPDQPGREPGELLKCETYLNLRVNPGLTDIDFLESNPDYNFTNP